MFEQIEARAGRLFARPKRPLAPGRPYAWLTAHGASLFRYATADVLDYGPQAPADLLPMANHLPGDLFPFNDREAFATMGAEGDIFQVNLELDGDDICLLWLMVGDEGGLGVGPEASLVTLLGPWAKLPVVDARAVILGNG